MFGVANAEDTWEDGVLVLGDSNFDEAIAKYDYLLVEFYAPWCGHCKKLTPEYAAAAQKLAALDPPRYLAKVDATEHKEVAERHGVKGFPTLVFYNQGTKSEYTGGRTEDTIVSWITKKTGPPSTEVDCATMEAKTSEDKLALSYFGESAGALWDAFFGAAKDPVIGEKYSFYHTADVACGEKFGLSASGVALSRRFDDSPLQYSGDQTTEALVNWGTSSSVPILITFSDDYVEPIFQAGNPAIILFTEETGQAYQETFAQAAKDLNGEILFVTSGVTEGIQSRLGEFVGVGKDNLPSLNLIDPSNNMAKYVWDGDVTALTGDVVKQYIADFKDGKLKQHLKSAPIPDPTDDGLTVLVGLNHDEVISSDKDVLVKYYAPWCGHCKSLAPHWATVAEETKDIEDLVIAKFDATENEVAGLEIRGYPTLKFYPKGSSEAKDYDGEREAEGIKQWLADNSEVYKAARGDAGAAAAGSDEL